MSGSNELKAEIKQMLVQNLMLQVQAEEILDDQKLFGPEGLGLDSVDALQLVVAVDKHYGLKISDPELARQVLSSINSLASAIEQLRN